MFVWCASANRIFPEHQDYYPRKLWHTLLSYQTHSVPSIIYPPQGLWVGEVAWLVEWTSHIELVICWMLLDGLVIVTCDWEVCLWLRTLAVSEWKTCSAANSVCRFVTRNSTRESFSAGSSSWSSLLSCSYVRFASSNCSRAFATLKTILLEQIFYENIPFEIRPLISTNPLVAMALLWPRILNHCNHL